VESGDRDGLVELRDLYRTLLETAGCDTEVQPARDIRGHPDREAVAAEYWTPPCPTTELRDTYGDLPERVQKFDRGLQAVRTQEWKLVLGTDRSCQLYNVLEDPDELTEVSGSNPDVVEEVTERLQTRLDPLTTDHHSSTDPDVSPVISSRLEDLGYI
jgi:arylsulfatase A-like enzyme